MCAPGYHLRPEIVESTYYLYHYTRDPHYLRMGETLFRDFVTHCKTEAGYAALKSVVTRERLTQCQASFSPKHSSTSTCYSHRQKLCLSTR
ncbi:MAG: glycoside hydrolase family 47 protein [Pyrinomonadaceae bacterium]|nr:glycoside hydrolase family 47 protein [Pyrinomonadaceae bacterium]